MTTVEMRDGKTPSSQRAAKVKTPPTPEEMIEALKQMGYAVELPTFPPYIEDMSKVLVDVVQQSTLDPALIWRQVAAKLNENNWRPAGAPMPVRPQPAAVRLSPVPARGAAPSGRMDDEGTIIAPATNMLNLDMDPSQL